MRTKTRFSFLLVVFTSIIFFFSCQSQPKGEASLQELIVSGQTEAVKNSFQLKQDINKVDENGNTVLHAAAQVNNVELVQLFLSLGVDTELKNKDSDTALHVAIKNNGPEAAEVLSVIGKDIFAMDAAGKTAIELGLEKGSAFYKAMINSRTGSIIDSFGRTILHYMVNATDVEAVKYAITQHIPLSPSDNSNMTPLKLALLNDKSEESITIAADLLLAGAKMEPGKYEYFENAVLLRNPSLRLDEGQTPLHIASIENHIGITSYLVKNRASLEAQDIAGSTPLHESIRYGNVENARILLEAGAKVNAKDNLGKTPILLIIPQRNRDAIYSLLLEYNGDVSIKDMYGDSVLHTATMNGASEETFTQLLAAGADINERNKDGVTPLALAIDKGKTAIITYFVDKGADIHAEDTMGRTPLTRALEVDAEMTKKILTPQNIFTRDSYGNTVYHIAIMCAEPVVVLKDEKKDIPVADDLMATLEYIYSLNTEINTRNRNGDSPLSVAVQRNVQRAGEFLLSKGADIFSPNNNNYSPLRIVLESTSNRYDWFLNSQVIQQKDGSGNTPLHYAADWKLPPAIEVLTEKGADPNPQNANGETPLFNGIKVNDTTVIATLINKGARYDSRDYLGNTVMHTCVRWDSLAAMKQLIDLGADLNQPNIAGKTPLAEAVRANKVDATTMLLENGADVNATDKIGRNILMDALESRNAQLISILLNYGASPQVQQMYGRNAFHEAAVLGDPEILTLIRKAGGDPLSQDTDGNTPLSIVFNKGKDVILAVLGTSPVYVDSQGNTPVHIAVEQNVSPEVLQVILGLRYPLDRRNSSGRTPVTIAASKNNPQTLELLLKAGADPFISDNRGESAVSIILKDYTSNLDLLVQYTGNKTDNSGEGILHYAAKTSDTETVKKLLSMGLKTNIRNTAGETPYDIAVRWQRKDVAALLK